MDKKEKILHYHRIDGLSQREIARRVGVSRKTVKRYITEYETLAQTDPEDGINMCLASEPKYPTRKIDFYTFAALGRSGILLNYYLVYFYVIIYSEAGISRLHIFHYFILQPSNIFLLFSSSFTKPPGIPFP